MIKEECCYCGQARSTRDHIPPRSLFSRPRPQNLVTVPACARCNSKFSKNDEYFRIAITTGIDPQKFPKENADSVRAINSLIRPESLRFAAQLWQGFNREQRTITFERQRIRAVIRRITMGLFYHHFGRRLSDNAQIPCALIDDSPNLTPEDVDLVSTLAREMTTIGEGVFSYAFSVSDSHDPVKVVWLMRFYQLRTFIALTS